MASLYGQAKECAESAERNFEEIKNFTETEARAVRADFENLEAHVSSLEALIGDVESAVEEILALQERGEMVSYPAFEKMLGIIKKYEER